MKNTAAGPSLFVLAVSFRARFSPCSYNSVVITHPGRTHTHTLLERQTEWEIILFIKT